MRIIKKRRKIHGTAERPRLSVYKSLKHIHCQLIDDNEGKTITQASTTESKLKRSIKKCGNTVAAAAIGKEIAKKAVALGIKKIVFDRGRFLYHGRVKALADAAREGGLEF